MRVLRGLFVVAAVLALPADAHAITIVSGPPEVTNMTSATFTFALSEGEPVYTSYQCQLDGGAWTGCASGQSYSGLPAGTHNFGVRGLIAPNTPEPTSEAHHLWTIDLTPPVVSITSGPSGETTARNATFTFSSNEVNSSFQCALDGGTRTSCGNPVTFADVAIGNHTLSVVAVDQAGNPSAELRRTWTRIADNVPPQTTITAAPPSLNNIAAPSVEFVANEQSTFECSVNGGPFGTCASPSILSALVDGAITFRVRAVDLAGNVDATPATAEWTRDTAPPAPPAVFIGRRTRAAQSATATTATFHTATRLRAIGPRAPDAGASEVEQRFTPAGVDPEAGTWAPLETDAATTRADITVATGATGCVRARSLDAAGNRSAWTVRCTTVPHRASGATVEPPFSKRRGGRYFAGQYVRYGGRASTRGHLRLRLTPTGVGAEVRRVSLVATTCRRCGDVRIVVTGDATVPVDAARIAGERTLSLRSARTRRTRVLSAIVFDDALPSVDRRFVYVFAVGGRGDRRIEGIGVSTL